MSPWIKNKRTSTQNIDFESLDTVWSIFFMKRKTFCNSDPGGAKVLGFSISDLLEVVFGVFTSEAWKLQNFTKIVSKSFRRSFFDDLGPPFFQGLETPPISGNPKNWIWPLWQKIEHRKKGWLFPSFLGVLKDFRQLPLGVWGKDFPNFCRGMGKPWFLKMNPRTPRRSDFGGFGPLLDLFWALFWTSFGPYFWLLLDTPWNL